MAIERRHFLQGLFGGIASGGLIVSATPGEIEAFASPLGHLAPIAVAVPASSVDIGVGQPVFDATGKMIGIIDTVEVTQTPLDRTTTGDMGRVYAPGQNRVELRVIASGPVKVNIHH